MTMRWMRFAEPWQAAAAWNNKSKSTTTIDEGPWSAQQPYIKDMFGQAQAWFNNAGANNTYFPGSTVAPVNPTQQQALGGITDMASAGGSGLVPQAQQLTADTLGGKYLDGGNPYSGAVADAARSSVLPAVDARFGAAGRFGSSAHAGAVAGAMTNAMAPYAYGTYQDEREAQQQASLAAPGLDQASYQNLNTLLAAGGTQQAQSQQELAEQLARYSYNRDAPLQNLAAYHDLIGGTYGKSGTSTTTSTSGNPWATGAGILTNGLQAMSGMGGFGGMGGMFGGGGSAMPTLGSMTQGSPFEVGAIMRYR
jgi:hypothetical protein